MYRIFLTLSIALLFALPAFALAQTQLVPCGGQGQDPCQACHVIELAQNIINFLVGIAAFIAVALFAYAGFLMFTAAGNESQIAKGKGFFTSVFIGIVIVLIGWLLVDTLMKWAFQGRDNTADQGSPLYRATMGTFGPWNQINCVASPTYQPASGNLQPGPAASVGERGCPDCVAIDSSVATCKDQNSCTVSAAFAQNLDQLDGFELRVTEGYPPTRQHQNACHTQGTCLDVTINNWDPDNIRAFQAKADAAGYRAVYEPPSGVACPSGTECLPYSTTRSTGNHFSLYKK